MPRRGAFRRILVATDFSAASRPAIRQALALARSEGAELFIVHVLAPPGPVGTDAMLFPRVYEELDAAMRQDAEMRLRRLLRRVRAAGARASALLLRGAADRQILRSARSKRADLLVLGTHGRTGLARMLLGSVATRVIPLAPCPVLTVPARRSTLRSTRRA